MINFKNIITRESQEYALIFAVLFLGAFIGFGGGFGVSWAVKTCPLCPSCTYVEQATTTLPPTTTTLEPTTTTVQTTSTTTIPPTTTTGSTLPQFRVNPYTGALLEEDAQKLLELAMARLGNSTTTTNPSSHLSSAAMFNLYNRNDMDSYGMGQYYVNKSSEVRFKTVDGSNRWSVSETFKLFNVEQAEARAYFNDWKDGDENVEGVYRQLRDGSLKRITDSEYFAYDNYLGD